MKPFTILTIMLFSLSSCYRHSDKETSIKALKDLTTRIKELPQNINDYKLSKTVSIAKYKAKIELWEVADITDENRTQEVAIFYDSLNKYYAVPLFSNTYYNYYNFEFDHPLQINHIVHTTFEKELNNAMDSVYNDNVLIQNRMLTEFFNSIFNCKPLSLRDTSEFLIFTANSEMIKENHDSCFINKKINIKKFIYPNDSSNREKIFFHDWKNERAFCVSTNYCGFLNDDPDAEGFKCNLSDRIKIKTFRLCCFFPVGPRID